MCVRTYVYTYVHMCCMCTFSSHTHKHAHTTHMCGRTHYTQCMNQFVHVLYILAYFAHVTYVTLQSLEGQLVQTNTEFEDLQANVEDLQKKSIRDRETLKIVTK